MSNALKKYMGKYSTNSLKKESFNTNFSKFTKQKEGLDFKITLHNRSIRCI